MPFQRNIRVLFDANVFLDVARSETMNTRSEELEKVIREHHYVIKSKRLLKHYTGAIHNTLFVSAEPIMRAIIDKLESHRPKRTKSINDRLAERHDIGFSVHSDDHFLYQLAIEASRRCEVLFVSNDPSQTQNTALMRTNHNIPIIDSNDYVTNYC